MAILVAVLVEFRRADIRAHRRQLTTSYMHFLRVRGATVSRHVFTSQDLLLRGTRAHRRVGRRNDAHEWKLLQLTCHLISIIFMTFLL